MKSTVNEDKISKFKEGDVVISRENPSLKLVVFRYTNKVYYCSIQNDPTRKHLVYFERDLLPANGA